MNGGGPLYSEMRRNAESEHHLADHEQVRVDVDSYEEQWKKSCEIFGGPVFAG